MTQLNSWHKEEVKRKMFIIKLDMKLAPNRPLQETLALLSHYKVQYYSLYTRKDDENGTAIQELIVVNEEMREGDLRLAEIAFQMNCWQEGLSVCPLCKEKGKDYCGHLVFVPYKE